VTRSLKAKALALLSLAGLAVGQAGIGGTFSAFTSQTAASGNVITAATDFRGPAVSPIAIGRNGGNATGAIPPLGTYYV
jgi:hypothetical protein